MTSQAHVAASAPKQAVSPAFLLLAAPIAAIIAGVSAEWLDFRALRYPLLLMVLAAVVATQCALDAQAPRSRSLSGSMLRTVLLGVFTWGAAQTIYVALHVLQGERFDAPRFGPQALQALGLIAAHALFLGAPTGFAAGVILQLRARLRRMAAA
jgi:hypothetical protein